LRLENCFDDAVVPGGNNRGADAGHRNIVGNIWWSGTMSIGVASFGALKQMRSSSRSASRRGSAEPTIAAIIMHSSRPLQQLLLPDNLRLWLRDMLPESYASTSGGTRNPRIDQLDPGILESRNQLHERIDVAADDAVTGFHTLDRRHRKVCQLSHLPLIDVQERPSSPELIGGNHELASPIPGQIYIYNQ
jgi:hypothetical protein